MNHFPIISDAQVAVAGVRLADYCEHVAAALLAQRHGELSTASKRMVTRGGVYASGCHAAWWSRNRIFYHNLYGSDQPSHVDGSHYRSSQLIVETGTLQPDVMLTGSTVSTMVPVAVSCLAAQRLARPASSVLGLIGAGLQARLHMAALKTLFPLTTVVVHTRSEKSYQNMLREAQSLGLSCNRARDARTAVEGADIVVSSISDSFEIQPFLSLSWLGSHAFLSSVDLLRPWTGHDDFSRYLVADDPGELANQIEARRVPPCGRVDGSLAAVLESDQDIPLLPRVLVHPGCAAALFGTAEAIRTVLLKRSRSES